MHEFKKTPDPHNDFDNTEIIVRTDEVCLSEILEVFADYLKACGFHIGGPLIVDDEEE